MSFSAQGGECLVLDGQSGAGKSTLLRSLYGNYLPAGGSIRVRHVGAMLEMVGAQPRENEPTASLDDGNRQVVLELMNEAKADGAALIGIFHDRIVREAVAVTST